MSQPSAEEVEEFMLSCRYGEIDEVKMFTDKYGNAGVEAARDDRGNTALHMCSANGHIDILNLLLPLCSAALVSQPNDNGSPPLHWAIVNNHLNCVQALVELSPEKGGGLKLVKQTNSVGRDAFAEAVFAGEGREEVAGWLEGYLYREEGIPDEEMGDEDVKEEATDEMVADDDVQGTGVGPDAETQMVQDIQKVDLNPS
ncbi:hypothetical protein BD324DRAFT_622730 [Kockovaella imperatae]|uniref:Uncharacterized protein n=1 Tax=Kockovaella imperatae TaxID=4999 RepID=A0A1Y1UJC7_9TREE|nr:hypothetical protein BD324DRAFT_622730 [Kockovaella imperatae]ORX37647.1 hypothetical protein BD324DRAFT_622730 [Kockovaella imperatae]